MRRISKYDIRHFKRDTIRKATNWRVRPIFSAGGVYGWNLIDPRGLVRRSFFASLNEVVDVARHEARGMRT
jgi:hypothetical protein